jgi:hypothetical protein
LISSSFTNRVNPLSPLFEKIDALFEKIDATYGKQAVALLQRPVRISGKRAGDNDGKSPDASQRRGLIVFLYISQ